MSFLARNDRRTERINPNVGASANIAADRGVSRSVPTLFLSPLSPAPPEGTKNRPLRTGHARAFALNSSVGADAGSGNLYLRTKGEAEAACRETGFESLLIFRPGLLKGERTEFRLAERVGILAAPVTDRMMVGPLTRYRSIDARDLAAVMLRETLAAKPGEQIFEGKRLHAGGAGSDASVADRAPVS